MITKKVFQISCLVALLTATSSSLWAATYRYKNDEGRTVMTSQLTQEAQKNGYQVLNNQGIVVKEVPPPLSAEELEKLAQTQLSAEQQKKIDANLLKLYSRPEDVDRALDRRLAQFDQLKRNVDFKIDDLEGQRKSLESEAARLERNGVEVSQEIQDTLKDINEQLDDYQLQLEKLDQDKVKARTEADYQKKRLKELLHITD